MDQLKSGRKSWKNGHYAKKHAPNIQSFEFKTESACLGELYVGPAYFSMISEAFKSLSKKTFSKSEFQYLI